MKRMTLGIATLLAGVTVALAQTPPRLGLNPPATTTAPRLGLNPPASATAPRLGLSTTASKPAVDRSTPGNTWAALCAAIKAGDLEGFRAGCYNKNEISQLFMEAYSDTLVTSFQLAIAAGKLGAEGQKLSKSLQASAYDDLVKSGQNRTTRINGDAAQWVQAVTSTQLSAEQTMYFKKVGKEWLLDTEQSYGLNTAEGRKGAEGFIEESKGTLKALKSVVGEINSGKITTVKQMQDRMSGKP